ncbi:MAG: efflux transporter outer membrane subunit [Bdellovibrionales bacterium]
MTKFGLLLLSSVMLSGCFTGSPNFPTLNMQKIWGSENNQTIEIVEHTALKKWWLGFNDPVLNTLIDYSMSDSPDRLIAAARISEARGVRRTARSNLLPQIGASLLGGRQDNGVIGADNYYDAAFDASFEIDVFGKNRKNLNAADAQIEALEAQYQDVTLTLVAEVTRSYIGYRAFQKQNIIAKKNLEIQEKTLDLIRQQFEFGEAPRLDVERSENLVNTTRSSIPEFKRLADNARLQLIVLTGQLPDTLLSILSETADIPGASVRTVLMTPADVLTIRPDIRAASANLEANTKLAESVTAELLPNFTISGFYGIAENALTNSTSVWNIALGAAVSLLDFGRIEGRIDAARAREVQAFQLYRKTILEAVSEVETALTDIAHINEQRVSLQKAYQNADQAFMLSESLYREGEISFLDVLDAQRTVNEADSALITAEAAQAESLVRLFKSLGVY